MKQFIKLASIVCLIIISIGVNAQIKVFSSGNISLGSSTTPLSGLKVQVFGNCSFTSTTGTPTSAAYIRGLNSYSTATTPDYTWYNNDQVGIFHPSSNTIGFTISGTERMRINSSGNIQINTTSLNLANLNVYNNQTGNQRGIYLDISQNADWMHTMTTKCYRPYSVNYVVNLDNNGDKFYVQGDGLVCTARGVYNYSDISLKENIENISNALDKVLQLRGVNFNYKPNNPIGNGMSNAPANPSKQMGLIAQEVEQIIPEVVITTKDGIKAVAYQNLVGLLIEAIKEQNVKLNQFEQDLNSCCTTNKSKSEGNNSNDNEKSKVNNEKNPILYQNKPNPFKDKTSIEYYVPESCDQASILIFDMQGKLLKTIPLSQKGKGDIIIDSGSLYPGMFLYTLMVSSQEIDTKRMILTQ
ncbi:MAG: tail fiber domain-containing protein [Bacteroidota bacterium]